MLNKYQSLAKSNTSNSTSLQVLKDNDIKSNSLTPYYKHQAEKVNESNNKKSYYLEYVPANQPNEKKILSITNKAIDPLEPTKFKHRRMQKESEEEQVPILRSPPKRITSEEIKNWKVPPCISNYKNQKGYTIPLQMRVMADMRSNTDIKLNEKFSNFADIINIVEKESRKELEERSKAKDAIKLLNNIKQEQELLQAATEARRQKIDLSSRLSNDHHSLNEVSSIRTRNTNETKINSNFLSNKHHRDSKYEEEINERNQLRDLLRKEIKREKHHIKPNNNIERDISEKIALGQVQPSLKQNLIDSRLYNHTSGIDSGFKQDEEYDLYDKPLFQDRSKNGIFNKNFGIGDDEANDEEYNKIIEKINKRDTAFNGAISNKSLNQGQNRNIDFDH